MSERTQTPTAEETPAVKVVFFGDSITASNRNLNRYTYSLGVGYVKIAAGKTAPCSIRIPHFSLSTAAWTATARRSFCSG